MVSAVASSGLTTSGATIGFTTNEPTYHQVEYGPTAAYGTLTVADPTLRTSHSQVLTGLTAGAVYHYRVRVADASGNGTISGDFTFTTPTTPPSSNLAVGTVVSSDGAGTRVTPLFSTATAGELLVAFASADGPANATRQTLTVSGAGLTWTLARRGNTQFGTAEMWTATAPTPLANVAVTATAALTGFSQSLTVVTFVGADGIGATAAASAATGVSSVSLTTTRAGSLVYGVGNDSVRAVPRMLATNQTMVHEWFLASEAFWVQRRTTPMATAGSVATINDTGPTSGRWNYAAVEILAASTAQAPVAVPNVVSQTQAAATTAINNAALVVGTVTECVEWDGRERIGDQLESGGGDAGGRRQRGESGRLDGVGAGGGAQRRGPDAGGGDVGDHGRGPGRRDGDKCVERDGRERIGDQLDPVAGTQVAAGSAVNLVVSTGSTRRLRPDDHQHLECLGGAVHVCDHGQQCSRARPEVPLGCRRDGHWRALLQGHHDDRHAHRDALERLRHELASATFTGETASGWQTVTFSSPVAIAANTVYVVSYHTNVGQYGHVQCLRGGGRRQRPAPCAESRRQRRQRRIPVRRERVPDVELQLEQLLGRRAVRGVWKLNFRI